VSATEAVGTQENLLYQVVPVTKVEESSSSREIWLMRSFQREYVGRSTGILVCSCDESRRQEVYRARFREARLIATGIQSIVQFGNWEDAMKASSPFAHYHDLLPL
jgi:hypothetical protein